MQDLFDLLGRNTPGQPFAVRLTAAELLDLARHRFGAQMAALVEDVRLELRPGEVALSGAAAFHGLPLAVQLTGRPAVEGKRARLEVRDLTINRLPAPPMIRQQVDRAINERLDPAELRLEFDRVEVEEGAVYLEGRTLGAAEQVA